MPTSLPICFYIFLLSILLQTFTYSIFYLFSNHPSLIPLNFSATTIHLLNHYPSSILPTSFTDIVHLFLYLFHSYLSSVLPSSLANFLYLFYLPLMLLPFVYSNYIINQYHFYSTFLFCIAYLFGQYLLFRIYVQLFSFIYSVFPIALLYFTFSPTTPH